MSYFAGKRLFTNNANTVLAAGISAVATTATLNTGGGALFPSPTNGDYYIGTFVSATNPSLYEVVKVTAMSGDTISTMVRAQEGTTAQAWNANDTFALLFTQGAASAFQQPDPAYLKNFFVDPCCRVAQIGTSSPPSISTSKKYGVVDLVQMWVSGGTVSAGTITQDATGIYGGVTPYAAVASGVTTGSGASINARKWLESADAGSLQNQTCTISCKVTQNTGAPQNVVLQVNTATSANNFASTTNIGTSGNNNVPSGVPTTISFTVNMGACGNGIEVIANCGFASQTTKNFAVTDWQLCLSNYTPTCVVPEFARDLADAMRYYEQSYEYGTAPGTVTQNGSLLFYNAATILNASGVYIHQMRVSKVITPNTTPYSKAGTAGKISVTNVDEAVTTTPYLNSFYLQNNSGGSFADGAPILVHFTSDARL